MFDFGTTLFLPKQSQILENDFRTSGISTTYQLLRQTAQQCPDTQAVSAYVSGYWKSYTFRELRELSDRCAVYLMKKGLKVGDKVAVVSTNRLEWYILDNALSQIGAVNVSLFPNYRHFDLNRILEDVDPVMLFISDSITHRILLDISEGTISDIPKIGFSKIGDLPVLSELLNEHPSDEDFRDLEKRRQRITQDHLYTLFYTSGTSGKPKGVAVSHRSIIAGGLATAEALNASRSDKAISFLSIAHAYERGHYLAYIAKGVSCFIAPSSKTVIDSLKEVQPTIFVTVPLILRKIHDALLRQYGIDESDPCLASAYEFEVSNQPGECGDKSYALWRSFLPESIRVIVSSGGPLDEKMCRFFYALGLPVQEIYGSSECFCVTFSRPPNAIRFGTVGPPAKGVQIRLADDGEILCKSPYLLDGYYYDGTLDRHVFDEDGYFPTGDIGYWVDGDFLKLAGRKCNNFKLSSGYYVVPEVIENEVNEIEGVANSVVFQDQGGLGLLVQVNMPVVRQEMGLEGGEIVDENLKGRIAELVDEKVRAYFNDQFPEGIKITRIQIDIEQWSVENGALTPTMKVKRRELHHKLNN